MKAEKSETYRIKGNNSLGFRISKLNFFMRASLLYSPSVIRKLCLSYVIIATKRRVNPFTPRSDQYVNSP